MMKNVLDSCCQSKIPLEYLDVKNHPTPSDLERNMGKALTDVYLKTCTPFERTLFGRDKPLKGPDNLWISPEDRCNGRKVRLTPLRTESLQALTHQGILEIGKKLEKKFDDKVLKAIKKAVKETEELADFEAEERLKFHLEAEKSKLNEAWQKQMDQFTAQHEDEKKCLKKLYEDARDTLRGFIENKCAKEKNQMVSRAIADVEQDTMRKCEDAIEIELTRLSEPTEQHQSKSIKHLWREFLFKLEEVETEPDADEMRILDEIHRVRRELMMETSSQIVESDAKPDEIFIIHESVETFGGAVDGMMAKETNRNWIGSRDDATCDGKIEPYTPLVDIEWKRLESDLIEIPADSSTSSVFRRFSHIAQHSLHPSISNIASSIICLVRESQDENKLKGNIAKIIQDVLENAIFHPSVDVASMPRTVAVSIKDSSRVLEELIPFQEKSEVSQLLFAVDSLELIKDVHSQKASAIADGAYHQSIIPLTSSSAASIPPYMIIPKKPCSSTTKVTAQEWRCLEEKANTSIDGENRESSVRFDELHSRKHSPEHSQKLSIGLARQK